MQIIQLILSRRNIKVFLFIFVIFFQVSLLQAKETPVEDVVLSVNNQLVGYSHLQQKAQGRIIHDVSGKFIKTSLNQSNELVFILAGQSNMAGYGRTAQLPAPYRKAPANVKFYFNGYPAKMSRFAHFGPEIGFAYALSRRFPHKTIKLIKFAVGGTSLFAWDPYWQLAKARMTGNASAGPLFEKLIKTIKRQGDIEGVKFAGVLWMQGEEDARHSIAARSYAKNLVQFVRALRKELNMPSLAFFMAEVDPPIKAFPYRDIVRQAQRNSTASIRNSRLISTQGLQKQSDNLHYNTAGQLALGIRFAKAFIQTIQ